MLRLLHTADWHLGHTLHGVARDREHRAFLQWLAEQLRSHAVDALIMAGDIFDSANPPAAALQLWYDFLAEVRGALPHLEMVFIAGNHDSAARIDAPGAILEQLRVRVIGGVPRDAEGQLAVDRLLVPLHDRDGAIAAWCAAIPYLRAADLPPQREASDPLVAGVQHVYRSAFDALLARRELGQAVVATGHCYMVDAQVSELSERKILGGNQHALPVSIFPRSLAHVALGHMHLPQSVGERASVRYSGSPIPLSFAEIDYRHQVLRVDIEGERLQAIESLHVPRSVALMRIPSEGAASLQEIEAALAALPERTGAVHDPTRPLLEVAVTASSATPGLWDHLRGCLEGKLPRLLKLTLVASEQPTQGLVAPATRHVSELTPEEVLRQRYAELFDGEPPADLLAAYHDLLERVEQEGD